MYYGLPVLRRSNLECSLCPCQGIILIPSEPYIYWPIISAPCQPPAILNPFSGGTSISLQQAVHLFRRFFQPFIVHCFLFLLFSRPPRPLQSITKAAKLGHTFCRHFSILNSVSNNATDFALALLDRQPLKIWFLFKLVLKLFSSQSGPRLALQQNINITSPGHASGQHL